MENSDEKQFRKTLECGPMPNVMVAMPNIDGALILVLRLFHRQSETVRTLLHPVSRISVLIPKCSRSRRYTTDLT